MQIKLKEYLVPHFYGWNKNAEVVELADTRG